MPDTWRIVGNLGEILPSTIDLIADSWQGADLNKIRNSLYKPQTVIRCNELDQICDEIDSSDDELDLTDHCYQQREHDMVVIILAIGRATERMTQNRVVTKVQPVLGSQTIIIEVIGHSIRENDHFYPQKA